MKDPDLIFVNERPYARVHSPSGFRERDLLADLQPYYFSDAADLIATGIGSEKEEVAALAMRSLHATAVETLFAFTFATLQAPHAPVAWLLLYRPRDLRSLVASVENGTEFPCRIRPPAPASWTELAGMFMPQSADDGDWADTVEQLGQLWKRLALEYCDSTAIGEYNALKHGMRARTAAPTAWIGGRELKPDKHGSMFPLASTKDSYVLVGIGMRSWSADRLRAEIKLISIGLFNIVEVLRSLHRIGESPREFHRPTSEELEQAKPVAALTSMSFGDEWSEEKLPPIDKKEALRAYKEHPPGPLELYGSPPS